MQISYRLGCPRRETYSKEKSRPPSRSHQLPPDSNKTITAAAMSAPRAARGETIESNSFCDKLKALRHCRRKGIILKESGLWNSGAGRQMAGATSRALRVSRSRELHPSIPPASLVFQQQIPPRPAPPAAAFRQQLTASMAVNYLNVTLYRV